MATHQDYWPKNNTKNKEGDKAARRWLQSLEIGEKILHPKPNTPYNLCDPSGRDFETVSIKSIHPDHLIISYPTMDEQWDKKLPLKYAFAVRPLGSIKDDSDDSSTSDASILPPEHIVPFPESKQNIKNGTDKVQFTFAKKTKQLNRGREHIPFLGAPSSTESPESTPPAAANTLYNKLHVIREKSTEHPGMKRTYATANGSRNRRNRAIKAASGKKLGHLRKSEQLQAHLKKRKEKEEEEQKREKEEDEKSSNRHMHRNGGSPMRSYVGTHRKYNMYNGLEDDENQGPMTRHKCRQQREREYVMNKKTPHWLTNDARLMKPIGLQNMGNTCFMNSTLQSLIHTEELRRFFLNNEENKWLSEQLNTDNPIGYGGKIALNFSKLVYKQCEESENTARYWDSVRPHMIHSNLTGTLRQFADYRQHDAQEFLTNFLDGLHEDLNRIRKKKYMEIPDFDKKEDEKEGKQREFLHKRWHEIYLKRNHSVCTDLFAGLLKSTVTCPTCNFSAITFDPFMHLLLPLKAPKSMLRATRGSVESRLNSRNHNHNYNKRMRCDSTDEDLSMGKCQDMAIHLIPKEPEDAPVRFVMRISEDIIQNNDWIALHGLIYDVLIAHHVKQAEEDTNKIAVHRTQMLRCPDYTEDEHYLYYGSDDVDQVKHEYEDQHRIPKAMDPHDIVPFAMFRLFELYQEDKVLNLADICKQNYNVKIEQYVSGGGHRRLCVQQVPSHWTDSMRLNAEEAHTMQCFMVFKKPEAVVSGKQEEDADELCDNKKREMEEEEEIPYEPFNYPRVIFNHGITAKLDEAKCEQYLTRIAEYLVESIAGDTMKTYPLEKEMEIRYCRAQERYSLDKIGKWNKVMHRSNNTNNNSNSKPKAVHTMVIVFSFAMHQIYTQHQRDLEEKKEQSKHQHAATNRKRSFQAMNGGNRQYNGDSVHCMSRKRQRIGNRSPQSNGYANKDYDDENEDETRDASLPLSFQPRGRMAESIKECFGIFLSREQLGKDNQWFCKKCKDHVRGRKKLDLWWLPSHLIIAIKRFDNHGLRKYNDHIEYPVNGLDLSDIIRGRDTLDIYHNEHDPVNTAKCVAKQEKEQFIYDLYAVINHSGSLNFGHYTASIKFEDHWYGISDSSVNTIRNPISSQAYILCYKRKQPQ